MPAPGEAVFIGGPVGWLEALSESPRDRSPSAAAVICHPHPLHGGTMHNKVVHTLARAFMAEGHSAVRFNFRGAGQSEGRYDQGSGELRDALAVVQWLREKHPALPIWLAGFSFGAAIAVRASTETDTAGLITVAPPVSRLTLESQPECPWLIIQGDRDELVNVDETVAWVNKLHPGPELTIFPETTHFFHGKLVALRRAVENFVAANSYRTVA